MKIRKIKFENYKAFRSSQEIEIKPITILIGRNSSGKSVVSRLPVLIARSLRGEITSPMEIRFDELDFGGSFIDLIHNRFPHGNLQFQIDFEDGSDTVTLSVNIQNIADSPIQVIKYFKLASTGGFNLELEWVINDKVGEAQYYDAKGVVSGRLPLTFRGFLPVQINHLVTQEYFSKLKSLSRNINYLGPFRQFPERIYRHSGSTTPQIGFRGKNAPQILGTDFYKGGEIIEGVGSWFKEHLGGWRLGVEKALNFFELVLISPDDPNVKVNIVDVGHGMSQVLPIVVRNFVRNYFSHSLEVVEQPELHLHPQAHGSLAELFVSTAQRENSDFLIETHSENFILRIRKLVAAGVLKNQDVLIYWVDDDDRPGSNLKRIEILENGDVSDWPEGIFSESLNEVIEIRQAQKSK